MIRLLPCINENLSVEKQGQEHSGNTDKCQHKAFKAVFFFVSQIDELTCGRYAKGGIRIASNLGIVFVT